MSVAHETKKPSLRNRLLRHVLLPLALTWLLGSALVVAVAAYFTQQAFDRSLLDDAYLVASHAQQSRYRRVGVKSFNARNADRAV